MNAKTTNDANMVRTAFDDVTPSASLGESLKLTFVDTSHRNSRLFKSVACRPISNASQHISRLESWRAPLTVLDLNFKPLACSTVGVRDWQAIACGTAYEVRRKDLLTSTVDL